MNDPRATELTVFQQRINSAIEPERRALVEHRLYARLHTVEQLAVFMQYHVFAVWDFMSLLKALQKRLTCVSVPWRPQGDAAVRRLINEIVLGEESDALPIGKSTSHFELYLQAMSEAGANTERVEYFLRQMDLGQSVYTSLALARVQPEVGDFVRYTFAVIERGRPHEIAAAFTYGREDLIPDLFTQLVHGLERQFPGKLATFRYYLDRHIELDGNEHGAMGRRMVELLCEGNPEREKEATQAAVQALQARNNLWEAIAKAV
jgi:hypothetical protein